MTAGGPCPFSPPRVSNPRRLPRPRARRLQRYPPGVLPPGWTLDVHQTGAWWEKPLIPRALIVERCEIKPTWGTDPDLSKLVALPAGSDVNLLYFMDDHHCDVGWQNEVSGTHFLGRPAKRSVVPPSVLAEWSGSVRPRVALPEPLRHPGRRASCGNARRRGNTNSAWPSRGGIRCRRDLRDHRRAWAGRRENERAAGQAPERCPGRTAGRGLSGARRTVALHQRSRLFCAVRPGERCRCGTRQGRGQDGRPGSAPTASGLGTR